MSNQRIKPADVMLDLLRGAGPDGRQASYLIDSGRLFGFAENTVRVTLSRLASRGLVTSPTRGRYRLAESANAVNSFVERWRLGEARVREWPPRCWLLAHPGSACAHSDWALDALGFRLVRDGLFARPDNLNLNFDAFRELALSIGVSTDTLLAETTLTPSDDQAWRLAFDGDSLNRAYQNMTTRLEDSMQRLDTLTRDSAKLESFALGGAGINLLVKDPLLPAPLIDAGARKTLWETMMAYDRAGRQHWSTDSKQDSEHALPVRGIAQAG